MAFEFFMGEPELDEESLRENLQTLLKGRDIRFFSDTAGESAEEKVFDILFEMIQETGFINLDFEDVKQVLNDSGIILVSRGCGTGTDRAKEAVELAVANIQPEYPLAKARGVVLSITAGEEEGLDSIEEIADSVREAVHPDAAILFGATFEKSMKDEIQVTVIATGFEQD